MIVLKNATEIDVFIYKKNGINLKQTRLKIHVFTSKDELYP